MNIRPLLLRRWSNVQGVVSFVAAMNHGPARVRELALGFVETDMTA
jgi:hypothetical protein